MEQGGQAEDGVLRSELQPLLVDRGREDHVAVGVGGRFWCTGGAGGVDHQGDVVAGEFQRWWNGVVVVRQQVQQPDAAGSIPRSSTGSSVADRKSRAEVVIVVSTAVAGSDFTATSSYRSSRQIKTRVPESTRILVNSRSRSIGLQGTTTAPHFQAASRVIMACGTFCRYMATRSPGWTPASISPTASADDA